MNARIQVQNLLDFIDASPSPWHAVRTVEAQLSSHGFVRLNESARWSLQAEGRYYVVRGDSSIILFVVGQKPLTETGFKIIGAHTDSPGLRIKPNGANRIDNLARMNVEVYGGPILATFADRDLSLAGRISFRNEHGGIDSLLLRFDEVLLRLPNLAIHMNRTVNDDGLKFNKQTELQLLLSVLTEQQLPQPYFLSLLEELSGIDAAHILSWDLNVYDTQKGAFWGAEQEFYADSQLDNLASCHAGLQAILDESIMENSDATLVCAFFDHEEIGSESHKGAAGSFLKDTLQRITLSCDGEPDDYNRAIANSFLVSADMAHAYQPNFANAYDPDHKVFVNNGPVIKVNAGLRYSSESWSEALFVQCCEEAGVPHQKYSHRSDIPCGSTIGPIASAKLGIRAVDVGNPMWAMHSIRESAGVLDHDYMIRALTRFLAN